MANCKIDHSGEIPKKLQHLPESQAYPLRHKCAACAYAVGLEEGVRQGIEMERNRQKALRNRSSARSRVEAYSH